MKQQIHPGVLIACLVVAAGAIVALGMHAMKPETIGGAPPASAPQKQTINGMQVPANVPSYYWQEHQQKRQ